MKWVLVTGGSRSLSGEAKRMASMLGTDLAASGFGLVCGDWPGVDRIVSSAYCHELTRQNRKESECFRQVTLPRWKRNPLPGYRSKHAVCRIPAGSGSEGLEKRIALSDAGVIVAGLGGAMRTAQRFIDQGKPVFPLPATGGGALDVYQEILKTWRQNPVPGVTKAQFLQLSLPWIGGTGPLRDLLLGTLSDSCDIFISYRRSDSEAAAGRLHQDLADYFGSRRVFMDVDNLMPSDRWQASIDAALRGCRIGICIIGRNWMMLDAHTGKPRIWNEDDVLRKEIAYLLEHGKSVIPLVAHGGELPDADDLPPDIRPLLSVQAQVVNNVTWQSVIEDIIRVCRQRLS